MRICPAGATHRRCPVRRTCCGIVQCVGASPPASRRQALELLSAPFRPWTSPRRCSVNEGPTPMYADALHAEAALLFLRVLSDTPRREGIRKSSSSRSRGCGRTGVLPRWGLPEHIHPDARCSSGIGPRRDRDVSNKSGRRYSPGSQAWGCGSVSCATSCSVQVSVSMVPRPDVPTASKLGILARSWKRQPREPRGNTSHVTKLFTIPV